MTQTQLYKVGEPDRHCPGKRNLSWCNIHAAPSSQAWLCWLQALTSVILKSTSSTMMGLEKELKEAAASLQRRVVLVVSGEASHVCTWGGQQLVRAGVTARVAFLERSLRELCMPGARA